MHPKSSVSIPSVGLQTFRYVCSQFPELAAKRSTVTFSDEKLTVGPLVARNAPARLHLPTWLAASHRSAAQEEECPYSVEGRKVLIDSILKVSSITAGQQIVALYQSHGFIVRPTSIMNSTVEMVRHFERLSTQQIGSRKANP
jgi:hypothetical protein